MSILVTDQSGIFLPPLPRKTISTFPHVTYIEYYIGDKNYKILITYSRGCQVLSNVKCVTPWNWRVIETWYPKRKFAETHQVYPASRNRGAKGYDPRGFFSERERERERRSRARLPLRFTSSNFQKPLRIFDTIDAHRRCRENNASSRWSIYMRYC